MNAINHAIRLLGSQANLAKAIGVTPQFVNQWVRGVRKIPWMQCRAIEVATKGEVTRYDLRPDIFGERPQNK